MANSQLRWSMMLSMLFIVVFLPGCSSEKISGPAAKRTISDPPSEAALAMLAKADAADSSVDKVISKCVTCRLFMDGKTEHSVKYGEYSVHLCSAECKEAFSGDPEKALLALNLAEKK